MAPELLTLSNLREPQSELQIATDRYVYQPLATRALEKLNGPFAESDLWLIILWKTNRYVEAAPELLEPINSATRVLPGHHRDAEPSLRAVIRTRGIDLSLASTIFRFRNPTTFQIIDRRAYRFLFGQRYPVYHSMSEDKKISTYWQYLDRLREVSTQYEVDFSLLDRALYQLDKEKNHAVPI